MKQKSSIFLFCVFEAPACPSNFRWDASTNLCYFVEENPMTWQNANTHCQSLGARLAILDTQAKLNLILNGLYTNFLNYMQMLFILPFYRKPGSQFSNKLTIRSKIIQWYFVLIFIIKLLNKDKYVFIKIWIFCYIYT